MEMSKKRVKLPRYILWEITSKCNLSCQTCYIDASQKSDDELEKDDIDIALKSIIKCKPLSVGIGGGEPLLKPEIFHIIKTLRQNDIVVRLNTNGILEPPLKKLKDSGVNIIKISVDGFRESHEKIRGHGTYNKTIKNLKRYIKSGIEVGVVTIITTHNINEIPELASFFYDMGVCVYACGRFVPMGRGAHYIQLTPNKTALKKLKDKFEILEKKIGSDFLQYDSALNFFAGESWRETACCEAGRTVIDINPNGDLVVCPHLPIILGNIKKDDITDIWKNSKKLKDIRRLVSVDLLEGKCKNCSKEIKDKCRGGCRGLAYYTTGNIHAPDPRCWRK